MFAGPLRASLRRGRSADAADRPVLLAFMTILILFFTQWIIDPEAARRGPSERFHDLPLRAAQSLAHYEVRHGLWRCFSMRC